MKIKNGLVFPGFLPMISGNMCSVFIDLALAFFQVVELPPLKFKPNLELAYRKTCFIRSFSDKVNDFISQVMGNPVAVQSSPSSFFRATYSSEISATTLSFLAIQASSFWIFSSSLRDRLPSVFLDGCKTASKFPMTSVCH